MQGVQRKLTDFGFCYYYIVPIALQLIIIVLILHLVGLLFDAITHERRETSKVATNPTQDHCAIRPNESVAYA